METLTSKTGLCAIHNSNGGQTTFIGDEKTFHVTQMSMRRDTMRSLLLVGQLRWRMICFSAERLLLQALEQNHYRRLCRSEQNNANTFEGYQKERCVSSQKPMSEANFIHDPLISTFFRNAFPLLICHAWQGKWRATQRIICESGSARLFSNFQRALKFIKLHENKQTNNYLAARNKTQMTIS